MKDSKKCGVRPTIITAWIQIMGQCREIPTQQGAIRRRQATAAQPPVAIVHPISTVYSDVLRQSLFLFILQGKCY